MPHRRFFTRTATIALAATAFAAQPALAQPADMPELTRAAAEYAVPSDRAQKELRESVAGQYGPHRAPQSPAVAREKQNRRPHVALAGAYTPGSIPAVSYPSATSVADLATPPSIPGPPTWPVNPQKINPIRAIHASDTGGGLNRATIALGIAGLLTIGCLGARAGRKRRMHRARVIA